MKGQFVKYFRLSWLMRTTQRTLDEEIYDIGILELGIGERPDMYRGTLRYMS
ncbi:hypothetical protein KIN20_036654 [Parelaphostrongylus tenuis]|uniref:Uncharacterized protein n=1 Tax=Parelaphostrongylus tenuis TaxID=148309 RepID=A0AAD5WLD4_PARTN|nr:hypothetical protein KIN20_036654 [Parelaphostrongylus tenuis]